MQFINCLNVSKTRLIWFGTKQQLLKLDLPLLSAKFHYFTYSSSVRNLGVLLDSNVTFYKHHLKLTRSPGHSVAYMRRLAFVSGAWSSPCPTLPSFPTPPSLFPPLSLSR